MVEPEGDIADCVVKNIPILNHLEINKAKIKYIISTPLHIRNFLKIGSLLIIPLYIKRELSVTQRIIDQSA